MGKNNPLVAVTIGFAAGLAFGEIFTFYPILFSILFSSLLLIETGLTRRAWLPLSILIPSILGFIVYHVMTTPFSTDDLRLYVNRGPLRIVARVSGPPRHHPEKIVLPMKGISLEIEGVPRPVEGFFQLTIYNRDTLFEYGDRLEMELLIRRPQQFQNPGAFQYADYREREGWSGVASLPDGDKIKKTGEGGNPVFRQIYRWREKIRRQMIASLEGVPAALLMALIIGESGYLTDSIRETFSASGTTHILSISGSHLALVSILCFTLIRFLLLRIPPSLLLRISIWKIPSQWAALLTAAPVTFYAFLAGGEIATLRSLVMILVHLFSIWAGRGNDVKNSLSFAALLILLFQPLAIFDLSFQFSFLSLLTLLLFMEWSRTLHGVEMKEEGASFSKKKLIRPMVGLFFSTLAVTLGLAPLSLYYFHQFSWVGIFANWVIVPLAGWILVPFGLFSAMLSLVSETGFPFSAWHHALGLFYYRLTAFFSGLPGAELHFPSPSLLWVILFYIILFSLLLRPVSWKWIVPVLSLFFAVFLGWGAIRLPPGKLRVSFLDVGQGDATLIEFPHGKTMLIDGGGGLFDIGKMAVAPYLWERKIRTIDYLVGTHPQMDHMGGLPYIVRQFNVTEIWTDGLTSRKPFYQSFSEAIERKGLSPRRVHQGEPPMEIDRCRIFFLNPSKDFTSDEKDFNNQSVVFRLSCPHFGKEGISFLFTGDIEAEGENRLLENKAELKSTILKVPHHGSRSSSQEAFISAVSPQMALISVGKNNPYHHPDPEILNIYERLGIIIHRTDQDGALIVTLGPEKDNPSGPTIQRYRRNRVEKIEWGRPLPPQEWNNIRKIFFSTGDPE